MRIIKPNKEIKFTLNGNIYRAVWNTIRNGGSCVDIENLEPFKGYQFFLYENSIKPAFEWYNVTDEHKELYYFLEGVNFYEVLKPEED